MSSMDEVETFFTKRLSEKVGRPIKVTVEPVALNTLLDTSYERKIQKKRLAQMKEGWHPLAAMFLLCNIRPGKTMIHRIEGRHRQRTAMDNGETHWPALVSHGLFPHEEACMWDICNTQRGDPSCVEALRAQSLGKIAEATKIVTVAHEKGFVFPWESDPEKIQIDAVGAVNSARKEGVMEEVLDTASAWKNSEAFTVEGLTAKHFRALLIFLALAKKRPQFSPDRLISVLKNPKSGDARRLGLEAKSRAPSDGEFRALGYLIGQAYDFRLGDGKALNISEREFRNFKMKGGGFKR